MKQVKHQTSKQSYLCKKQGHENQKIIGFCLYNECKNNFPFCLKCLTNSEENLHEGHKNYCIRFESIIVILEKEIQMLTTSNEKFQKLEFLFKKIDDLIENTFLYKSKRPREALSQIFIKLQQINHSQILKIRILQNWLQYRKIKDYQKIQISEQAIRNIYCLNSKYKIFKKIYKLIDLSFKVQQKNFYHLNVQGLIRETAMIFFERGRKLGQLGQYSKAINLLDQAINRYPFLPNMYCVKGYFLGKLQKHEDANKCYDQIIKLDPNFSSVFYNKGNSLCRLGKYEDAIRCFNYAIIQDPQDYSAYYNKGFSLYKLCQYKDAAKCFDEAIKLEPKELQSYFNKGGCLFYLKKYEEAIKCYDKVIELDPQKLDAINYKKIAVEKLKISKQAQKIQR